MRKIFDVQIDKSIYPVFDIPDKEHESENGEPTTWWLYYYPLKNGETPNVDSEAFIPYHVSINRLNWDISVRQNNTTKMKWNNYQFRCSTFVEMRCNGNLIYSFSCGGKDGGLDFAMSKVGYLKTILLEHPYNFLNPEEEKGRKIYWKGLPATIQPKKFFTWEIAVIPDYTEMDKESWWAELKRRETLYQKGEFISSEEDEDEDMWSKNNDYINWGDALSDQYIGWFRE